MGAQELNLQTTRILGQTSSAEGLDLQNNADLTIRELFHEFSLNYIL